MKAVVERVARRVPVEVQVIDISGDAELERLYGEQVPVLMIDGRKVAKYRIREDELGRRLDRSGAGIQGPDARGRGPSRAT